MSSPNLTYFDVANLMDGVQYREEDEKFSDLFKAAKANRLVVVFGASDDLVELRGAIDEEYGAYGGLTFWVNQKGDISTVKKDLQGTVAKIEALWCDEPEISWTFRTDIPHATFNVFEGEEIYCRAFCFNLDYLLSEANII